MKVIRKDAALPQSGELARLCPEGRPLFFDIETTGLSAERSRLYLIGCCYPGEGTWKFVQWFAQNRQDEKEILAEFAAFVQGFSLLIHFNGDHFDLPYLHRRAEKLGIPEHFLDMPGIDLYKRVRPCRNFMGLPNCRLKTIEAFLGLPREDTYNGGQLIDIYREYVRRPDPRKEHFILLHNEEDILGMPELLPVLSYPAFLGGDFTVRELADREKAEGGETFTLRLSLTFPCPVVFTEEGFQGLVKGSLLRLTVPSFTGELRYFFADYRDYYYLPGEDTAIHRSVAAYVDKDYREKATAKTAYTRKTGTFLKLPGDMDLRTFRREYGSDGYLEAADPAWSDRTFWESYLKRLVCLLH